jgi:hypothetical protein
MQSSGNEAASESGTGPGSESGSALQTLFFMIHVKNPTTFDNDFKFNVRRIL